MSGIPAPVVKTWQDLQQNFDWLNGALKAPFPWYARYTADSGAYPVGPVEYIWNNQLVNEHSLTTPISWGGTPVVGKGIRINKAGYYEIAADLLIGTAGGGIAAAGRYDTQLRVNNITFDTSLDQVKAAGDYSKQQLRYDAALAANDVISIVCVGGPAYDGGGGWTNLNIKRTR